MTRILNVPTPESILVNEVNEIRWDFEIQTDHLFLARRRQLMIINKKRKKKKKKKGKENLPNSGPGRLLNEMKRKTKQVLGARQRIEKAMEHESDGDSNYNWYTRNGL